MNARDEASYMAVACDAVMTYDKALRGGYLVDNLCPKCRRGPDTNYHRIWRCQHQDAVSARQAVAPSWLIREAENAEGAADAKFWVTGIIPHPGDEWPRPSQGEEAVFEWIGPGQPSVSNRSPNGKPHVHGQVYIDGSCTTNVFPELRRAAAALIQWAYTAESGWRVLYPVPRTLPQTPQAAEYVALALTCQSARCLDQEGEREEGTRTCQARIGT